MYVFIISQQKGSKWGWREKQDALVVAEALGKGNQWENKQGTISHGEIKDMLRA